MSRTRSLGIAGPAVVALCASGIALAAATPSVTTGPASPVAETTATLRGSVNPQGSPTTYRFDYGTTSTYTASTAPQSAGSSRRPVAVSAAIGGLAPATTYHYRLVASNRYGNSFGADRTLHTTGHPLPVPVTGLALSVNRTSVTLAGAVGPQSQQTRWYFQYGTSTAYGAQTFGGTVPAGTATVPVRQFVGGLAPGTVFHYRLIAVHDGLAPVAGADAVFGTLPYPRLHAALTSRTLPTIAASKPYVLYTTGKLIGSTRLPPRTGCFGFVDLRYVAAGRVRARRSVPIQSDCTYTAIVVFHRRIGGRAQRMRVDARFRGNGYYVPVSGPSRRIRVGL